METTLPLPTMSLPAKGDKPVASGEAKQRTGGVSVVLLTGWRNLNPVEGEGRGEGEGKGEKMMLEQ